MKQKQKSELSDESDKEFEEEIKKVVKINSVERAKSVVNPLNYYISTDTANLLQ